MRPLHEESGFTLPEVLTVLAITVILMGGLATIFSLGLTTTKTASSVLGSQSGVVVALDRLDYEARCASNATLVSGGAGVTLTFPSQCTHTSVSLVTHHVTVPVACVHMLGSVSVTPAPPEPSTAFEAQRAS